MWEYVTERWELDMKFLVDFWPLWVAGLVAAGCCYAWLWRMSRR